MPKLRLQLLRPRWQGACLAASKFLVDRCEILGAVWDGGQRGTADAVDYARSAGPNVAVIWPRGASRS